LRWDDEVLARGGLQSDGSADADRQRNFQRKHRADACDRQPAADQQDWPATRFVLFGSEELFYDDRRGIGVLVRHSAVGEVVVAELSAGRNAEVFGQGVLVDRTGARV
jgi:hypothetical protein